MVEDRTMSPLPLEVVIFSKDRACQLDALLRSMDRYFQIDHRTTVLYTATTKDYFRGYGILQDTNPGVAFIKEQHFKEDLVNALQSAAHEHLHLMFLVDDIIFIRSYIGGDNLDAFTHDESILTLSLRLGENITYCHPRDIETVPHDFSDSNMWYWQEAHTGYWNYPMSLDGHIFRSSDIVNLVKKLDFHNPNTLEALLAQNALQKPLMLAEKEPYLVNLALNRVQDIFSNPHGSISTEQLNSEFLNGEKINIDTIVQGKYTSCHVTPEIHFISGKSITTDPP